MELNNEIITDLANKLNVKNDQITAVLNLLSDDKTVAFIARYRKENTGGLDEEQIRKIEEEYNYEVNLDKRKNDVIRLIDEKKLLTEELKTKITECKKLIEVEDLYRPFKEKKKTKATEAIALGLEPLADLMLKLYERGDRLEFASKYVTDKVKTPEEAIALANYIIAERISDDASIRKYIRDKAIIYGTISTKKKNNDNDPDEKFKQYYESSECVSRIKEHRILAINRAEALDVVNVTLTLQPERDIEYIKYRIIRGRNTIFKDDLILAINDAYKRLIAPSISREIRGMLTEKADNQAINIFALNLKNLLMQSPMKGKMVLGVDPAFRTGCKLAVISPNSNVLKIGVIYPNEKYKGGNISDRDYTNSEKTIVNLVKEYKIDIIAIGNGTASRETEGFIADVIKKNNLSAKYVIVSEAGASVYSASDIAIEEFPDLSVEQRSAISIARRIQDPLAELVKIDPKSIGVGQYQHDLPQAKLNEQLDNVVIDAVNKVGVNLNTASLSLLSYVSGLNKTTCNNIIKFRVENEKFTSREQLKKVPKLGEKTYEMCVGFLRIEGGDNPLDMTSIHPESYSKALKLLEMLKLTPSDLGKPIMAERINDLDKTKTMEITGLDKYTLNDILEAFKAPLRDIREDYEGLKLRSDIVHFEDIKVGDELDGVVRNVCDFGAFVDCGVKYDGLVHVSKMSTNRINHPADLLAVGDNVHVYVIDIDYNKHRLGLSLIKGLE